MLWNRVLPITLHENATREPNTTTHTLDLSTPRSKLLDEWDARRARLTPPRLTARTAVVREAMSLPGSAAFFEEDLRLRFWRTRA